MKKIMILSQSMVLPKYENVRFEDITFYHFHIDLWDVIQTSHIVLLLGETSYKELKQRFSVEAKRIFPLDTLQAYVEYWSK